MVLTTKKKKKKPPSEPDTNTTNIKSCFLN